MKKADRVLLLVMFLALSLILASCGGGGDTGVEYAVVPLYAINGVNWNDYVSDDGLDIFSASDTACDPVSDTSCLHGGQMMAMEVPGYASCAGLTAYDNLQAFEWVCDDSVDPLRLVSTGFKKNKSLSDLIDFDSVTFRENNLNVIETGNVVSSSLPEVWWSNPVVVNNGGNSITTEGEIHIVTQNADAIYSLGADRTALLIKPGVELTGSIATNETVISANSRNFIWLEGAVDATGDNFAFYLSDTNFSALRNASSSNAINYGFFIESSSNNNRMNNITANGNNSGIQYFSGTNNSLSNIIASGNDFYGVALRSFSNNSLSNIAVNGNGWEGLRLNDSSNNNSLSNITANANGYYGVALYSAMNNNLSNITSSTNRIGVLLQTSSNSNLLSNITTSENSSYGVFIGSSLNNIFTGELQVGNNTSSDCYVTNSIEPGLVNGTCSNQGNSDAVLTTGVSVAGSFVDVVNDDYALLASDTVLRDVLALPTGNDTLTHTWSDASTTEMLRNTVEIMDDGTGNDNMICESNETCLYTPNISAYQGHDALVSAGTFIDGTITGVTLLKYETNGY